MSIKNHLWFCSVDLFFVFNILWKFVHYFHIHFMPLKNYSIHYLSKLFHCDDAIHSNSTFISTGLELPFVHLRALQGSHHFCTCFYNSYFFLLFTKDSANWHSLVHNYWEWLSFLWFLFCFCFFIVVMGEGTFWHLHRFLPCINITLPICWAIFIKFFYYYYLFIHMCVHCLGHFSPLPHSPPSLSLSPHFQPETFLPLSLILLNRRLKHNKEDKAFLLVELWIAIQKIPTVTSMYKYATTHVDSSLTDLYTGYWSHSHVKLCRFKVSVLVLLEWGHQMLLCFGFSTPLHISHMCSPLVIRSKSNLIAAFALDLKSAHEVKHTIFVLLSLANFSQNGIFLFHPFTCKG
jgi:hypothetical protein